MASPTKLFILFQRKLFNVMSNGDIVQLHGSDEEKQTKTRGGICIYGTDVKSDNSYGYLINNSEDFNNDKEVLREISEKLQAVSLEHILTLKEQVENRELIYFIKKVDIERLFRVFEFQKVIPIEYVVYKMGIDKGFLKDEYHDYLGGFIGKDFLYIKQYKDGIESFSALRSSRVVSTFEVNPQLDINNYLYDNDKLKVIGSGINPDSIEDVDTRSNLTIFNGKELMQFVNSINEFVVEDKISLHYRSKKIKPIMYGGIFLFIALAVYNFYNFTKTSTDAYLYNGKIQSYEKRIKTLNNNIKTYKKNNKSELYKTLKPSDLKKIENYVLKYNVDYYKYFIDEKKNGILTITVSSPDIVQNIINNKEKYKSIKINGDKFNIELIIGNPSIKKRRI